jgi:hypothetical protein
LSFSVALAALLLVLLAGPVAALRLHGRRVGARNFHQQSHRAFAAGTRRRRWQGPIQVACLRPGRGRASLGCRRLWAVRFRAGGPRAARRGSGWGRWWHQACPGPRRVAIDAPACGYPGRDGDHQVAPLDNRCELHPVEANHHVAHARPSPGRPARPPKGTRP